MSSLQIDRPNPAKPSVVKRNGVWLARVMHPRQGIQIDGALTLPDAFSKAVSYANKIARDAA